MHETFSMQRSSTKRFISLAFRIMLLRKAFHIRELPNRRMKTKINDFLLENPFSEPPTSYELLEKKGPLISKVIR